MKAVGVSRIAYIKAIAAILLLSSCGGGGGSPAISDLADDDCTPTINVSTTLQTEVDINGNVSTVPAANNTVTGCDSSSATGDALPTSLVTTRFENTEDFDVWDCIRTDGSSLQYALLPRDDFTQLGLMLYAFEIDPDAEDLVASQQLYSWRAPLSTNADTITLSTRKRVGRYGEGSIESEWTGIALATTDNMNFISSTEGAMQCNKTVSVVDLAASRFDIPCEYRGPVSAC